MKPTLDELSERVLTRLRQAPAGSRVILGITGSPGAGKTTMAEDLLEHLRADLDPDQVAHVPMDGYHLADVSLDRLGLRESKGAPPTFDAHGYIALLRRLRENVDPVVYAPGFDRDIEQPIAGSIAVPQSVRVIISEGNYLLFDDDWATVREVFDEVWFARLEEGVRSERLLARHLQFGKTREVALAWIAQTDEPNARAIDATMDRADLIILAD